MSQSSLFLSALYIYPIKSAGGISVQSSDVGPRGLTHDRRWMVVDASGRPITQREFPKMRLIRLAQAGNAWQVDAPQMPSLSVPHRPQGKRRQINMWGTPLSAVSVSAEAAEWFGQYLGSDADLVYLPSDVQRFQPAERPYNSLLSFVDGNPFHLITEVSLADLNARINRQVSAHEFRPNLVISGGEGYQEDFWRRIRVGGLGFEVVESCARCSIVNVNEEGKLVAEPLRTLARTRQIDKAVPFGQHLVQDAPQEQRGGWLQVGNAVEVLEVGQTANPIYE